MNDILVYDKRKPLPSLPCVKSQIIQIKFLLLVKLSPMQASGYYARPYTARCRAGRKNVAQADSPQATGY